MSNQLLSEVIEYLLDATFAIDLNGKVIAWNSAIGEMTDTLKDDILGEGSYVYCKLFYEEHRPCLIELIGDENSKLISNYDFIHREGNKLYAEVFLPSFYNGKGAYLEITASPLLDGKGLRYGAIESIRDITERKKEEIQLKSSLNEKEVLLREIHHRVKNNLQIISSLLNLQEFYVKEDPIAVNVLKESKNRVLAMAMIHEMLYQSTNLSHINIPNYIRNLISNLVYSYGYNSNFKTVLNVEEIMLNIETSIPVGLIIGELVSNSLRHAFPNKQEGKITLSLKYCNKGYNLVISDDGVGLPPKYDFRNVESTLGLKLVNSLVEQLDGSIELEKNIGTQFTIKFKEQHYKERI